jgi:hypothetical protein
MPAAIPFFTRSVLELHILQKFCMSFLVFSKFIFNVVLHVINLPSTTPVLRPVLFKHTWHPGKAL